MSIEDAIAKDLVAILFVTFTFGGMMSSRYRRRSMLTSKIAISA